jgi:hypothetical protein
MANLVTVDLEIEAGSLTKRNRRAADLVDRPNLLHRKIVVTPALPTFFVALAVTERTNEDWLRSLAGTGAADEAAVAELSSARGDPRRRTSRNRIVFPFCHCSISSDFLLFLSLVCGPTRHAQ